jgi:RHH-type proline utilization regulon transcriptional repressor/proline dehydrogenase/delta 1-pyrroline-5-carboxylate dehydrogenase
VTDHDIEAIIQERGRALLAAIEPEGLVRLSPDWWQERVLGWATNDPDTRRRLLQFVDVLPALRTRAAVADHIRQYFRADRHRVARLGAAAAGERIFRPVLSRVVREGVFAMAGRFIAAEDASGALLALTALTREGAGFTVDILGEATLSDAEADAVRDRYLAVLRALAGGGERRPAGWQANVSLKLSALAPRFEPAAPEATFAALKPRLFAILRFARETGAAVNVDMEQYRYRNLVHVVLGRAARAEEFRAWEGLGTVVQAYLRDAEDDIARLRDLARERGAPLTVRLVKGAYWDEEMALAAQEDRPPPVFREKGATDANYERCTSALIAAHPDLRAAFGTHNPRSIAQAMARAERAGLAKDAIEFQVLFGMAEGVRKATARQGYRTRVYAPIGEVVPGMAYLVRRLLENTSNESWFVNRHERGSPEELLAPPAADERAPAAHAGFANATPAQFHEAKVRAAMEAALVRARRRFGQHWPLLIDGHERQGSGRDDVRWPADPGVLVATVARADAAFAGEAVGAAAAAIEGWRRTPVEERAAILDRAAALLERDRFDLAATMVFESGKPWREADGDVCEAIDYLRYYGAEAVRLANREGVESRPGEANQLVFEPRGVAAVIAPWNFPLAILTGMSAAALAAGCTTVLKPAEQSPGIAGMLVRLLLEAGVPAGAVNYLPGPGEVVGRALVEHAGIEVIAFTGSNAVGLEVLREAAVVRPGQRNVKHVVLEMGGKNAVIVDEDADLDQAVAGVIDSAFGYAGQKCSACSRVVVVGSALGPFRERLAEAVTSLVSGPPDDPFTFVAPLIDAEAQGRLLHAAAEAQRAGTLVARGKVPGGPGWYVPPQVFEGVPPDSPLARRELFGPLLLLFGARTFAEALEMAMDSPFALTGGVFSRHPAHIEQARREFRVGNLYINRKITGAVVGRQPFGGWAMSGAGDKAGGPGYLLNFCVARSIAENTMRHGFVAT